MADADESATEELRREALNAEESEPRGGKTCFVIGPIGEPESDTRRRSDQVLRHIIRPVVEHLGYKATRADEIDKPGIITSQVIQRIVDDDLVVADLTERNPNVFYELAIRHAIAKPFVQIIQLGEELPFDIHATRTVFVNLHDPDNVEDTKREIGEQIRALETGVADLETPITVSVDLQRLRGSEKSIERLLAELIATVTENRREDQSTEGLTAKLNEIALSVRLSNVRNLSVDGRRVTSILRSGSGAYDFVVMLSVFRNTAPWICEIGMEAFRKAVDGDIYVATEIYREMLELIDRAKPFCQKPKWTSSMRSRHYSNELSKLVQ